MLHKLKKHWLFAAVILGISLSAGISLHAQEKKFFDTPVKFFGEYKTNEGCQSCGETPDTKTNRTSQTPEEKNIKLFVFINPESSLSSQAVLQAKSFAGIHPEVEVKGILISKIENLKETLLKNTNLFDKTFPFDYQPGLDIAQKYKITEVPCYVFICQDKIIKVSGQPDLMEVYKQAGKLFSTQKGG